MAIKFYEMKFDGTRYVDEFGNIWRLGGDKSNFYCIMSKSNCMPKNQKLTEFYSQKALLERNFKECYILSDEEKTILRNLNGKIKYIYRDDNGDLKICYSSHGFISGNWMSGTGESFDLSMFNHLFPMVKGKIFSIKELLEGKEYIEIS